MSRRDTEKRLAKLKAKGVITAQPKEYKICPSAIPELNDLLPGGFPCGKQIILFGSQSLGKTTTAVQAIAMEMERDPDHITLLVPAERGEDYAYFEKLGLDFSSGRVQVIEKHRYMMEETLEQIEDYLCDEDGECLVDSILIDSWDALIGNKEMFTPDGKRKEATKETVGVKAAAASKMIKRIKGLVTDNEVLYMVICQARTGIGAYAFEKYSGGNALEHFTDVTLHLKPGEPTKTRIDGQLAQTGHQVKFKLAKSKVNANVHKQVIVDFTYGEGWDQVEGIFRSAITNGIIHKGAGGWFSYPAFPTNKKGEPKLRGEANAKAFFEDEAQFSVLQEIVTEIREEYEGLLLEGNEEALMAKVMELYSSKYVAVPVAAPFEAEEELEEVV